MISRSATLEWMKDIHIVFKKFSAEKHLRKNRYKESKFLQESQEVIRDRKDGRKIVKEKIVERI